MIIKSLHVENFLSVKEPTRLEIAPITLLYGPNSSGKSVIPRALDCIRKWLSGDKDDFRSLSHLQQGESINIGISFELDLDVLDEALSLSRQSEMREYEQLQDLLSFFIHRYVGKLDCKRVIFDLNILGFNYANPEIILNINGEFAWSCSDGLTKIDLNNSLLNGYTSDWVEHVGAIGSAASIKIHYERDSFPVLDVSSGWTSNGWEIEIRPEEKFHHRMFPFATSYDDDFDLFDGKSTFELFQSLTTIFMSGPLVALQNHLSYGMAIVGPLRERLPEEKLVFNFKEYERPRYKLHSPITDHYDLNWSNGKAWLYLSSAFLEDSRKSIGHDKLENINAWLSADQKMGLGYVIVGAVSKVKLQESEFDEYSHDNHALFSGPSVSLACRCVETGLVHRLSDIGVGISQVVPVLVAGLQSSTVCVEQPELHLHPKAQAALGDYFASTWLNESTQWIVETHSELLALRLLRRLKSSNNSNIAHRDYSIKKEDIAFFYFRKTEAETEVIPLQVGRDGEFLDRWPDGFFAEQEKELFADD